MVHQRNLKRRHLIFFLNVYEKESGKLVGHLADITSEGILLVSEVMVPVGKDFHLKVRLPDARYENKFLEFKAQSLWSKNDINPAFYDTGFKFLEVSISDILEIAEIIKEFGFND